MRHRARLSVLDRLRGMVLAHRGAAVMVTVVTALAVTGVALTAPPAGPGSERTGSSLVGGDAPSYPPDQTPGSTSSRTPAAEQTDRERATEATSPSAVASTRAEAPVSRSSDRARPTDVTDPTPTPTPPEPSATTTESPAADAPQTSATTRSSNASRWVIGVGSDTDATYECSLDGGAFEACGTTVTYVDLDRGTHSFAARATDGEGNTDPTPATLTAEIGPRGQD